MSSIQKEEYERWLHDPVTRALREAVAADVERLRGEWSSGSFGRDPILDAYARGQCAAFQQIVDLDHINLESET